MNMSNPRVINKRGGKGKTDGEIALFLRGFPHCVGGGSSSFSFALQFPLVRVCFGPTSRLAFCPQWGLIGIDSFCHCICRRGISFPSVLIPLILSSTDCSGLPSLVASWNFNKISSRRGRRPFTFLRFTCAYSGYFSSINPSTL